MRIAYLDCFSGISGDMVLGALLDAGVPERLFIETVEALNLDARLEVSRVDRGGITATKVDVYAHGEKDLPREQYWAQRQAHEHREHEHSGTGHAADAAASHSHPPGHEHGRGLKQIREIIHAAPIGEAAKHTAIRIFETLGAAEAKIHNCELDSVHFHEVGAVDAIVDIVCAAAGAEALGVDEFICSPLNVGSGVVHCAHGTFPVPAPATLEILRGAPVYSSGIAAELVTPTGAAFAKTIAARFDSFPAMEIEKCGYGAGTRNPPGLPNVLRITLGNSAAQVGAAESIAVLEANLDDMNPQLFGHVLDRLLDAGALDVFSTPAQMKKNRPGTLLSVLCRLEDRERLAQLILTETTTFGVRWREQQRTTLPRTWVPVETPWGTVRVKTAGLNGSPTHFAPEYEDCRRLALEHGVPLRQVMQQAMLAYARLAKL